MPERNRQRPDRSTGPEFSNLSPSAQQKMNHEQALMEDATQLVNATLTQATRLVLDVACQMEARAEALEADHPRRFLFEMKAKKFRTIAEKLVDQVGVKLKNYPESAEEKTQ